MKCNAYSLIAFCLLTVAASSYGTLIHGRIEFTESGPGNNETIIIREGGSPLFDVVQDLASQRGDYTATFTGGASRSTEWINGVAISSPLNASFTNPFTPGTHATTAVDFNAGSYFVPVHSVTNALPTETNVRTGVAYFPYASGWLGGHFRSATNGGPLDDSISTFASGVSLASGRVIDNVTGSFTIDLRGLGASSDNGILLTTSGKNEDNITASISNPDGTFTINSRDNWATGGLEQDGIAFVHIPLGSTASAMDDGMLAFGQFNTDGTLRLGQGLINAARDGNLDRWTVTVIGQSPATGTLIVSKDEGSANSNDNFVTARPFADSWIVEHWDVDSPNTISVKASMTGPAFSAVFLPDSGTITMVPEPGTTGLLALGVLVLLRLRRFHPSRH